MDHATRAKLMESMPDASALRIARNVKIGICAALVAAICAIAIAAGPDDMATPGRAAARPADLPRHTSPSAAHRKQVFDERRARFEAPARREGNAVAGVAAP